MPEIRVDEIEFTLSDEGSFANGIAIFGVALPSGEAKRLAYVTVQYFPTGYQQIVTLPANRLAPASYHRVCEALGVEP